MSVTFDTTVFDIAAFAFACGHDNGVTAHRFGSFDDALALLNAEQEANGTTGGLAVCGDEYCAQSCMSVHAIENDPAPSVNVSSKNAEFILGLLGEEADERNLFGTLAAEDFLGRVMMAQAVNPADAGVPAVTSGGNGSATVVDCGRSEGYSERRLDELRTLAEFAVKRGHDIQWA